MGIFDFRGPSGLKHVSKNGVVTYKTKNGWTTRTPRGPAKPKAEPKSKYMNNGSENKLVPANEITTYKWKGWVLGKLIAMHKPGNSYVTMVLPSNKEMYKRMGYVVGNSKKK